MRVIVPEAEIQAAVSTKISALSSVWGRKRRYDIKMPIVYVYVIVYWEVS